MSYIGCLSNPEGLDVWHDSDSNVYWSIPNQEVYHMPFKVFDRLMKLYVENWGDDVSYAKAYIREISTNDGFRYRVGYNVWYIDLWRVTLDTIVSEYHYEYLVAIREKDIPLWYKKLYRKLPYCFHPKWWYEDFLDFLGKRKNNG